MSEHHHHHPHHHLAAAVLTTSGRWPDANFEKVSEHEKVKHVLEQAAKHLRLAGTEGWIATVGSKTLNPEESFGANDFTTGDILIDFGPRQGGGGRA